MTMRLTRGGLAIGAGLLLAGTVVFAAGARFSDYTPLGSSAGPTADESEPITFGNPLFQQILRGITNASAAAGYRVLVAETDEDPSAEAAIAVEARRRCDALIMVSPRLPEESLLELLPQVQPVILVNRQGPPEVSSVVVDYGRAVRILVGRMVDAQHCVAHGRTDTDVRSQLDQSRRLRSAPWDVRRASVAA